MSVYHCSVHCSPIPCTFCAIAQAHWDRLKALEAVAEAARHYIFDVTEPDDADRAPVVAAYAKLDALGGK